MRSHSSLYVSLNRIRVLIAGGCLIAAISACGSRPVPMAAQAGSTIAIAIGSELLEGVNIGYGGSALAAEGTHDDQRGELVFQLIDPSTSALIATMETVLVTRSMADPASEIGITNDSSLVPGINAGITQVVAIARIPETVAAGTYELLMRRKDRTGALFDDLPHSESPINDVGLLTVLPGGPAASTPMLGVVPVGDFPLEIDLAQAQAFGRAYPHPKLVVTFGGTTPPRAAHFVLRYPSSKIAEVRSVFEEQHFGRNSIVLFTDDPQQGTVTIDFADPAGTGVRSLAAALELEVPFAAPLELADFTLENVSLYDASGALMAGASLSVSAIR